MKLQRRLREIYSDYRIASLARKYYGHRLVRVKNWSLFSEVLLAVTASSAFASLKIGPLSTGGIGYNVLWWIFPGASAAAALLSVIKPLLSYDKEIERLTKLVTSYAELHEQLRLLVSEIYVNQSISKEQIWHAQNLQAAMVKLSSFEDISPNRKKLEALQKEVNEEIPPESLWCPDDSACDDTDVTATEQAEKVADEAKRADADRVVALPTAK